MEKTKIIICLLLIFMVYLLSFIYLLSSLIIICHLMSFLYYYIVYLVILLQLPYQLVSIEHSLMTIFCFYNLKKYSYNWHWLFLSWHLSSNPRRFVGFETVWHVFVFHCNVSRCMTRHDVFFCFGATSSDNFNDYRLQICSTKHLAFQFERRKSFESWDCSSCFDCSWHSIYWTTEITK